MRPRTVVLLVLMALAVCLTGVATAIATTEQVRYGHIMDNTGSPLLQVAQQHAQRTQSTPMQSKKTQHKVTATPTMPADSMSEPSGRSVQNEIQMVFGGYSTQALEVAGCMSMLNASYQNSVNGATGVFGISPSTWEDTPYKHKNPFNGWFNILAAHWLFVRDGYSWREWPATCQPLQ